ncbi:hypothetical protein BaRGS_00019182 [Batillaria attramentaria]|uniref:Uncharacterized protein n=1 Tax=Batillaria attramentaria TaxID=370345 RepID=A0ABD0KQM1_9CAEN
MVITPTTELRQMARYRWRHMFGNIDNTTLQGQHTHFLPGDHAEYVGPSSRRVSGDCFACTLPIVREFASYQAHWTSTGTETQ